MANLVPIFGSVVTDGYAELDGIDIVAFDIMGTLVDREGKIKSDVLRLFYYVADLPNVKTVFISTTPAESLRALLEAGCKHRILDEGIQPKEAFYKSTLAAGKRVLAIDDVPEQSRLAALCINPKDPEVMDFLRNRRFLVRAPV